MSSTQRGQSGQGAFELGSKKKFGKNLNKLQKPPAPPITNGATQSGSGSSRNGLLLLSTKRSSSGAGLLSSKPVQLAPTAKPSSQPAAIRKETYTSAHDALVDAVMGASRNDFQKEPDAWGIAEKPPDEDKTAPALASGGGATQEASRFDDTPIQNEDNYDRGYQPENTNHQRYGDRDDSDGRRYNRYDKEESYKRSDTDDTWRRGQQQQPEASDDQGVRMSHLARERAERRRHEEETRMSEQRDRASQRLRELEEKMGSDQPELDVPEHVDRGAAVNGFSSRGGATRTLYDPNKPYSSLVGGSKNTREENMINEAPEQRAQDAFTNHNSTDDDAQPSGPVIHLSSYEDRDRGESRHSNTAPRMLYDPKSGSMVAVSDNKAKKGKPKARRDAEKGDNGDAMTNGKKKGKGRNESTSIQRKDRRGGDVIDANAADESKATKSRTGRPPENRLPRTCGVLYTRDEKGNCYSADVCDGDQGYGCHGVPGGRNRNPVAYAKFEEEQLAQETENQGDYGMDMDDEEQALQGYISPEKVKEPVIDWVKPNEKIELLTGVQDSPTLQATAVPWAPSQAALSAAKERKDSIEYVAKSSASVDSGLNQSVEDEEDSGDDLVSCSFGCLTRSTLCLSYAQTCCFSTLRMHLLASVLIPATWIPS